jgi:arsenite oxidase small subunit
MTTSRRALLFGAGALGVACKPRSSVARLSELELGRPLVIQGDDQAEIFLVKLGAPAEGGVGPDRDIVAFHRLCPHQGCPLPVERVDGVRTQACPCHFSVFDLSRGGRQLAGRAPVPLAQVELVEDGDHLSLGATLGHPYGAPAREGA